MEQLIQGISGIFREIQGAVDSYMISKTSPVTHHSPSRLFILFR